MRPAILRVFRECEFQMPAEPSITNAMTVDVEDYFQVSAFEPHIARADWDRLPCRVERNCDRILALFDEFGVRGTFFVLGWVAERYPALVRRIAEQGHEVASHGFEHVRITDASHEAFYADVSRTRALLEDVSGKPVVGFRAASFSVVRDTLWALDLLADAGYQYSSSIYPVRHDLYGIPEAPRFAFRRHEGDILEIPVTTLRLFGRNLPCGGGGFFRLFPYAWSRWAVRRFNRVEARSALFYFHPWEIDPGQPRQSGVGWKTRVRHYLNLERMEGRLRALLGDFRWGRMDEVFLPGREAAPVHPVLPSALAAGPAGALD